MLYQKILVLFFVFIFSVELQSQEILISKPIEISNRTPKFKILGKNDAGFWIRNYGKNEERIDLYDSKLNLLFSRTLLIKRPNYTPVTFAVNERGTSFFYSDYHKKEFYLCSALISNKIETSNERVIDTVVFQSNTEDMRVSFSYSLNKKHISFFVPIYQDGQLTHMRIVSALNTGEIVFKSSVSVSKKNAEAFAEDGLVDNNGNTFLILKYESKNTATVYEVKKIDRNGNVVDSCTLQMAKPIFNDPFFQLDEKNKKLICHVFLDEQQELKAGARSLANYAISTDSLGEMSSNDFLFNDAFISDVTKGIVKENGALYTFKIKKVIATIDGGSVCIAESFYKEDNEIHDGIDLSMPSFGGSGFSPSLRTVNIYHYNDILVFYFDRDGHFNKYQIIRKKQVTENDNGSFSSFFIANNGVSLNLFYVDDVAVNAELVQEKLSNVLESRKKILLSQDEKNLMLIPKMAVQTQTNELVLPSYRNNDFRLIKINF